MTNRTTPRTPPRTAPPRTRRVGWLAPLAGFVLATAGGAALATGHTGCADDEETWQSDPAAPTVAADGTSAPPAPRASGTASAAAAEGPAPAPAQTFDPATYDGPRLGAMAFQTPVYPEPRFSDERLGYLRQGAKVPVDPKPIKKPNCKQGWYRLLEGGYVCGKYATLDLDHPRVKLGVRAPDREGLLPYQYAYNRFHGTPLYSTLPTREEMLRYEPYLAEKDEKAKAKEAEKEAAKSAEKTAASASAAPAEEPERRRAKRLPGETEEGGSVPTGDDARSAVAAVEVFDAGAPEPGEPAEPEPPKPWWQTDEKKPVVSLADLHSDADKNLSKRMVKGFFIAIDKQFGWNDRLWYRTTGGLVAPTDRMYVNKPPESQGIAWPEGAKSIAFVLGDKARRFDLTGDGKKMKDTGALAKQTAVPLAGEEREVDGTKYQKALAGFWIKSAGATITEPGTRPSEVGAKERWVDVDLSSKTLVLFEGDEPVYAALVSPGKRSREKKKDHATPTGSWRIREKHVAVTMDGDGASGDLPYSIEDVPYVAYYKGSYALHAAFWHSNFGREMSHGCVNLSPRDARHVFDWVEPRVPHGWHAVWATKDRPGSLVVVHE